MSKTQETSGEQWNIEIKMPDFRPRKVTAEELAENRAERNKIVNVYYLLNKFNGILKENDATLSQSGQDGIFVPDNALYINGIYAAIDNETGLFRLPAIPDAWDENTIVQTPRPLWLSGGNHITFNDLNQTI